MEKARILRNTITSLVKPFPVEEKYRLTDQIIRSSRSIGNNTAEGHGRFHYADVAKFLVNARGSASGTIDHLIIAFDKEYIDAPTKDALSADCEECTRMINGCLSA